MAQESADSLVQSSRLDPAYLHAQFRAVRRATEVLCEPLETEDFCIQSMPDASPTKWHLGHTSWFFETFLLQRNVPDYRSPHASYAMLFNSYYNSVGKQHSRPKRGLLSRPTVAEVLEYRAHVDEAVEKYLADRDLADDDTDTLAIIEIGLHHEQQHQELILMDIKHAFSCNPLLPAYKTLPDRPSSVAPPMNWVPYEGSLQLIGHEGDEFAYDNESPRHRTFVESFEIADRLVTCGEYLEFIAAGGYQRPEFWLSDGWHTVTSHNWQAPLYWQQDGAEWKVMTLGGLSDLNFAEPVSHVSYYEADAFARWKKCWLPRESAWEAAASQLPEQSNAGNFIEQGQLRPLPADRVTGENHPLQMFGDLWEWTCSPYVSYPGYRPVPGALGEYNGKFMCNQMVLRGGSYGTPRAHIRPTYRNFYPPDARWPFTGIRLTRELC